MLATLITRAFQVIFGAVVLGLSITAIKWQVYGSAPATTGYSAFAGAFTLLVALIGCVVVFIESIPGVLMAAADALAAVITLAGGIAFAVQLRGVSCGTSNADLIASAPNFLLNGGVLKAKNPENDVSGVKNSHELASHCRTAEADAAFLFLAFVACVAAAVLCFIGTRRGGVGRHSAV